MRGYPRNPNALTKVDILNLLSMSEYAEKAAKYLAELAKIDDSKITVDEGTQERPNIKQVDNPLPSWKRAGFKDKAELISMVEAKAEQIEEMISDSPKESCK